MAKTEENPTGETPAEGEGASKEDGAAPPQSYVLAQFLGPGQSGFNLTIANVDPWQLAGLIAELTDRAEDGRKSNRQRRMQEIAQGNMKMLKQKRAKKKTEIVQ